MFPKCAFIDNDKELDLMLEDSIFYDKELNIAINFDGIFEFLIKRFGKKFFDKDKEFQEGFIQRLKNLSKIKNFRFCEEKEYRIVIIDDFDKKIWPLSEVFFEKIERITI